MLFRQAFPPGGKPSACTPRSCVPSTPFTPRFTRSSVRAGYGFAAYVEKTVHPKFVIGGGYADIHGLVLNADRYAPGKRVFVNAKIPLNEAFSILVFWTQATAPATANLPQQRLDVGLYYNVLDFLRKRHLY